jgi:hypothetical protein
MHVFMWHTCLYVCGTPACDRCKRSAYLAICDICLLQETELGRVCCLHLSTSMCIYRSICMQETQAA